jgi:hypothetical protein
MVRASYSAQPTPLNHKTLSDSNWAGAGNVKSPPFAKFREGWGRLTNAAKAT